MGFFTRKPKMARFWILSITCGQWRVFVFKELICYLFLKAKAKGGAKGGGRRVALLEVVGVDAGFVAEPVHESGGPGGGT
jgi:hypothetical protein